MLIFPLVRVLLRELVSFYHFVVYMFFGHVCHYCNLNLSEELYQFVCRVVPQQCTKLIGFHREIFVPQYFVL